jgi:regulator of RNase E activity RraA
MNIGFSHFPSRRELLVADKSGNVLLSRAQVSELLKLARRLKQAERRGSQNAGGRPAKYDSEAFLE